MHPSPLRRLIRFAPWFALGGTLVINSASGASTWWSRPVASRSLVAGFGPELFAADALRPSEQTFLARAAELTRDEMRSAQIGVSQASSSEVRAFAQTLAADHKQLTEAIDALRRRKGSERAPQAETPSADYQQLAAKSGAEFDREFVRVMGEAHRTLITLFEQALADAKDSDVRDLIGTFLPVLREHGNRLTELKKGFE